MYANLFLGLVDMSITRFSCKLVVVLTNNTQNHLQTYNLHFYNTRW